MTLVLGDFLDGLNPLISVLGELSLTSCPLLNPEGFYNILKLFGRTLKVLKLNDNGNIGSLSENKDDVRLVLEELVVESYTTSDHYLPGLLNLCPGLKTLKWSKSDDINLSSHIPHIFDRISNLKNLEHFEHCSSTAQRLHLPTQPLTLLIQPLFKAGNSLKTLIINNSNISLDLLMVKKLSLSKIEHIDLSKSLIKDEGLSNLLRICGPNLNYLNLSDSKINGDNMSLSMVCTR